MNAEAEAEIFAAHKYKNQTESNSQLQQQQQQQQLLHWLHSYHNAYYCPPLRMPYALFRSRARSFALYCLKADATYSPALLHLHLFIQLPVHECVCVGVVLIKATNAFFFIQHKMKLNAKYRRRSKRRSVCYVYCVINFWGYIRSRIAVHWTIFVIFGWRGNL